MSGGESGSPSLADVQAVVRANVAGHVEGERHEHGKQRLLAALRQRHQRATASRRPLVLLAVVVLLSLASAAFAWRTRQSQPLTYEVNDGLLSESGYVRGRGPGGARLSFSDGTRVDLRDGARARIGAIDAHGARLAVENGRMVLLLEQRASAAWFVDAGPFVIQGSGAHFDVDWASYDDTLSIDLHEGSLTVSGPPAPAGVLLRAGQRLTAHEARLSIEALDSSATSEPLLLPLDPALEAAAFPSGAAAEPEAQPDATRAVAPESAGLDARTGAMPEAR